MRDVYSIGGMILITMLAGLVNFPDVGIGSVCSRIPVLMSLLVVAFWISYLVINRNSRGYLIWSLFLSICLLITVDLLWVHTAIGLSHGGELILIVMLFGFALPLFGLAEFSVPWLLPLYTGALLCWSSVHVYFLYRLRGEKGANHEA